MIRNLAEGMSGIDVKAVQQALNIWMPDRKPLVDDGKFGALTKAAVIEFQKRKKLRQDGIVGPYTLTALYPVAPYYGLGTVLLGSGPIAGARSAESTPLASSGSLIMEHLPGFPFPVPIPRPPAHPLARHPGLSPEHRQRVAQPSRPGSLPASQPVQFQSTQYQFGTSTTWSNLFKPGVTGLQVAVKGLFLLGGKNLSLSTGFTGTVAVDDGAKDSAAAIFAIAWAPIVSSMAIWRA